MQAMLAILAGLSYVIHMTVGCCLAHEHFELPGKCQDDCIHSHASASDHDHSHGEDSSRESPSPVECPHNHPHHDEACIGLSTSSEAKLLEDGFSPLHIAIHPISLPLQAREADRRFADDLPIPIAPPIRAHLAKLVITI